MAGAPCCRTLPDAALSITDAMRSNVASAQGRPVSTWVRMIRVPRAGR